MMMIFLYILLIFTTIDGNEWTFYSTNKIAGDHDCLFYDSRWFCRRPADGREVRNSSCNGKIQTMKELRENNISTDMLFEKLHPHDEIERYARFIHMASIGDLTMENETLCNCFSNLFGIDCIYERPSQSMIESVLSQQFVSAQTRSMALINCFVDDIECHAGLLCLEWRQICDGIVQCENGIDESQCLLLEFHECESDEYQCRNGMCIAQEFLFDGTIDCIDRSDEQETFHIILYYTSCPTKLKFDCDELLCRKDQFSCADGQCLDWRHLLTHQQSCQNRRNFYHRCELYTESPKSSTLPTGMCHIGVTNPISLSPCVSALRALLLGMNRALALEYLTKNCPMLVPFPDGPIITNNLKFFYNRSIIQAFYPSTASLSQTLPVSPHLVCLTGSLICDGKKMTLNGDYCFSYQIYQSWIQYPFLPVSHIFCHLTSNIPLNITWKDLEQKPLRDMGSSVYRCRNSSDQISLRRLNDGFIDCWLGDDETNVDYLPITKPYRYRCFSNDRSQYISVQLLGNTVRDCQDGSDELSSNLHWEFFQCESPTDYACWVFHHIEHLDEVELTFHHFCNSVWDIMDGRDEQNCSTWICSRNMYQCSGTGQCIDPKGMCDGEFDCANGEDEIGCSSKKKQSRWVLEDRCNDTVAHFCITWNYLNHRNSSGPCIPWSQVGDGKIDCIGGRDERNVFSCPDHQMLADRFLCDNKTRCISHRWICNGRNDCLDGSDELVCFWNQNKTCAAGQFTCANGLCMEQRCLKARTNCTSENEHLFWCPNLNLLSSEIYRSTKQKRATNYASLCNTTEDSLNSFALALTANIINENLPKSQKTYFGYCNRGFYLIAADNSLPYCLCSPSFYGDRCQFDRRRITVRVRLDRFYSTNTPAVLHVVASLVYNNSLIVDHTTFVDIRQDFPLKHDMHLLYPRPKPFGFFSIRFEAFADISLLQIWEYPISPLDFLPAFRLARILRFPEIYPIFCLNNQCQNNGTCYVIDPGQWHRYVCLCQREWKGEHCEEHEQNQCAPGALRHSAGFCICPEGYLLPSCFIRNTVCERRQPCSTNEVCIPHLTFYGHYSCLCLAPNCTLQHPLLILTSEQPITNSSFVVQLLKFSIDYPRPRQQFLVSSPVQFPIIRKIDIRDIRHKNGSVPEIGLLYTFHRISDHVLATMSLLYINCTNTLRNLTIDLDTQLRLCRPISSPSPPAQLLHTYCHRTDFSLCFFTNSYICYCSTLHNGSECISYQQRGISCSHCLNQGFCAQGDIQNRTDFECICPLCVTGDLCQFTLNRFSVSFEWLIEKSRWNRVHLLIPLLFAGVGILFNSLIIGTLNKKKAPSTATSIILLCSAVISQLLLSFLVIRVVYLQFLLRSSTITTTNRVLCKSLPYIMSSLSYFSSWLLALISVERALSVRFPLRYRFIQSGKVAILTSVIIGICLCSSLYPQIDQYKLIAAPNSDIWCVQEISAHQQTLFQTLFISHQLVPFMINVLAASVIIITVGLSKAASHHLPHRLTVAEQARKRVDLLLGPFICFIAQIPHLIMLFLNPCTYDVNQWFSHVALIAYYISFIPHISLVFMYIVPSPLYKSLFFSFLRRQN